jgi:amphi-Trp domain-containing protein
MSDMELKRKESLTRQEAANWLAAFAIALAHGGHVQVDLGGTTVRLHVPDDILSQFEVEVDGDELELDIELKWSTAAAGKPLAVAPTAAAPPGGVVRSARQEWS